MSMEINPNMLVRGTAADGQVMFFSLDSTQLVEEARRKHNLSPLSTVVLGRLLTAAALAGQELKGDKDVLTMILKGSGPAGTVLVTANSKSQVKGYIDNTNLETKSREDGHFDVAWAVGPEEGTLTVIRDLGLREPYVGRVELISGEIAEDMAYYYAVSQQTPSVVSLGVLIDTDGSVKHAGGFMLQVLPNTPEETIAALEQLVGGFPPVTFLLEEGFSAAELMDLLLNRLGFEITTQTAAEYHCDCSKDRMERKLMTIGRADLQSIVDDDQEQVELVCNFCNTAYSFTKDEIKEMIK